MIVGSDKVYAIENLYARYLAAEGAEVYQFAAQSLFYDFYQRSLFNKLLFKAGLSSILKMIDKQFRQQVIAFRPDIIWVFKGMEILPTTLKWIRAQSIFLANYNPDNPFLFTGSGSGNKNVTDSIALYDLHFTYNLEIKERLEREFKAPTCFLPFGFDLSMELYETCRSEEELNKVCFLGNPDNNRMAVLKALLDKGVLIDVYGHHWDKFIRHSNLTSYGVVYDEEFWKVLHRYRVQLNLMRVHNEQSHNMRTFEIPAVGAIQLAQDTPEHRIFFEPGREIFLFRDTDECFDKIKSLLELPPAQALEIRLRAREKSLSAGYSYKDRANTVFNIFKKLPFATLKEMSVNAQI